MTKYEEGHTDGMRAVALSLDLVSSVSDKIEDPLGLTDYGRGYPGQPNPGE